MYTIPSANDDTGFAPALFRLLYFKPSFFFFFFFIF